MFYSKIDKRIKILLILILFIFIIVVLKICKIQIFDYEKLKTLANSLWSRNLEIKAERGKILDRNGLVLADNETTVSLIVVPNQIKDKNDTSKKLAQILNVSKEEMDKHINKKTSIERVHPEGRRLNEKKASAISKLNLPGVYLVKESKRYYPYNNLLSHVLGYVGIDDQGLGGIEAKYDKYLSGTSGAIKYFSDAKGNKLNLSDVYIEPVKGMDVSLTIDLKIQQSVERELDNVVDMFSPDMALAVVMNPKTGEVLAMASRPNFDSNNYQKYSAEALNRNLPIFASYEPGSTFKIISMSSAVNEGLIDLDKDKFYDSGKVNIDGSIIKCWKSGGHGEQTFLQVLQNSCNPGFVKIGQMLGKEKLFSYIDKFGFGEQTGIDLTGEGKGIIFDLDNVGNVELATSAFGQGISVTPIQQISAVSAVVNGGNLNTPYVLKNIINSTTNDIVLSNNTKFIRKVISDKTSSIMRRALESVVAKGGGKKAYIEGYRIGGKTGTAQKVQDGKYLVGNYIMSFFGIVPSNNPEAVLYVAIDNPKNTALLSSYTTTPIARRILLDIIDVLKIKKQSGEIEKDKEWTDKETFKVPNVVNMNVKEAKKSLTNFQIEYSGTGEYVKEQSPSPGTMLEYDSTVRLYLK